MAIEININPTLIVMLGSTAGQIGYKIKQQLNNHYGNIPVIKYLWVDTDTNIPEGAGGWFGQDERAELVGYNANEVLQNLENFPLIKAWWPQNTKMKPGTINIGAKQIRLIGRLSLFKQFNEKVEGVSFITKLKQAAESIRDIDKINLTNQIDNNNYRIRVNGAITKVIMIFSTSGGTGSSFSIDMAYLVRYLLYDVNPIVSAFSIMPSVVDKQISDETEIQKQKIRANTYAWFKEAQHLMSNPNWQVRYSTEYDLDIASEPFDFHYLIDLVNEDQNRLNSAEDVYKMISQSIFLDMGTAIAGANSSFFTNVSVLNHFVKDKRQAYSSLATSSLVFPAKRLQDYCSSRFAKEMLIEGLLGKGNSDIVKNKIENAYIELKLRNDELIAQLKGKRGVALLKKPALEKSDNVEDAKLLLEDQKNDIVKKLALEQKQIENEGNEIFSKVSTELESKIASIVKDYGVESAQDFIQYITAKSTDEKSQPISLVEYKEGISESKVTLEDYQTALNELDEMDNLLKSAVMYIARDKWSKEFLQCKHKCINKLEKMVEESITANAKTTAKDIYSRILEHLETILTKIPPITKSINETKDNLEKLEEKYLKTDVNTLNIFELNKEVLGEPEYFDWFYKKCKDSLIPTAVYREYAHPLNHKSLKDVKNWVDKCLKDDIKSFAQNQFTNLIDNTSLLDAAEEFYGEKANEKTVEMLENLRSYCTPFLKYKKDVTSIETEGKSIIGVEDKDSLLIPDSYRDVAMFNLISTGFKHRIDFVRIKHGIPAFLLNEMHTYKNMYESVLKESTDPLHILSNSQVLEDIFPEENIEARRLFAKALAFDFIVQIGEFYYIDKTRGYTTSDPVIRPDKSNRLAQGRINAEEEFIHRSDDRKAIEEKISDLVEEMGNKNAISKIDEWIKQLKIRLSSLPASDDNLRPQLTKEIKHLRKYQQSLGAVIPEDEL